jgi:hypothetical protein
MMASRSNGSSNRTTRDHGGRDISSNWLLTNDQISRARHIYTGEINLDVNLSMLYLRGAQDCPFGPSLHTKR